MSMRATEGVYRPTCYMCEALATSREHAPPRSIFPEAKDTLDGMDYRKSLITVPSCEQHNSAKSADDEYLLHVLAASLTSSDVGLQQFLTKSIRAFERSPRKGHGVFANVSPLRLKRPDSQQWEDGAAVTIQGERLDYVLGNCARALYFHETGRKHTGLVLVRTGFTLYQNARVQELVMPAILSARAFFATQPPKGANPEVFSYNFAESDRTAMLLMHFYAYSDVLVRLQKL